MGKGVIITGAVILAAYATWLWFDPTIHLVIGSP